MRSPPRRLPGARAAPRRVKLRVVTRTRALAAGVGVGAVVLRAAIDEERIALADALAGAPPLDADGR